MGAKDLAASPVRLVLLTHINIEIVFVQVWKGLVAAPIKEVVCNLVVVVHLILSFIVIKGEVDFLWISDVTLVVWS